MTTPTIDLTIRNGESKIVIHSDRIELKSNNITFNGKKEVY